MATVDDGTQNGLPLSWVRVVDLTSGIAGAYCAKLLSGAGAEVLKVEDAAGDPLRRWTSDLRDLGGEDSALFRYLHHGQASVVLEPTDDRRQQLISTADVVIVDEQHLGTDADPVKLADANSHAVVVAITPYGIDAPPDVQVATELTLQADSGALAVRGHVSRPPIQSGGRVTTWVSGVFAAVATTAALRRQRATGVGELIDLLPL